MYEPVNDTIAVRDEERLDVSQLEPFLRTHLPHASGAFAIRQFPGGHANLTYAVRFGDQEWVLRRPPLGPVAPGAHDMRREYRVLAVLHRGFSLAPQALLLCTDHAIIGADFFVMERRHGIAFRHDIPEPWVNEPVRLRAVGEMLIDTLASLHAVDPAAVDLGDLGQPEGYVARQVERWIVQWHAAATPDAANADRVIAWLSSRVPASRRVTLVHNDYKLDNLLLDATDPAIPVAVLDWDMCTRGEPLMDLGYLLALWAQADDGTTASEGWMPTWRAGFPTRREAAQRYAQRSGAVLDELGWYVAFNVFRFAVILQQIYVRFARGQTTDARFAAFGAKVNALIARADTLITQGGF